MKSREAIARRSFPTLVGSLFLWSVAVVSAQTGADLESPLPVQAGYFFEYESVSLNESDMKGRGKQERKLLSLDILTVDSVGEREIYWTQKEMTNIDISEGGHGSVETDVIPVELAIVTDRNGRVISSSIDNESDSAAADLFSMSAGGTTGVVSGPGLFLPDGVYAREEGEEWTERSIDTIHNEVAGRFNATLIIDASIVYTYGGVVDTLESRAFRLSWVSEKVTMSGEMTMQGAGDGVVTLDVTGRFSGIAYYSVDDRLLLAKALDMETEMNVDAGAFGSQSGMTTLQTDQTRVARGNKP